MRLNRTQIFTLSLLSALVSVESQAMNRFQKKFFVATISSDVSDIDAARLAQNPKLQQETKTFVDEKAKLDSQLGGNQFVKDSTLTVPEFIEKRSANSAGDLGDFVVDQMVEKALPGAPHKEKESARHLLKELTEETPKQELLATLPNDEPGMRGFLKSSRRASTLR